jgi:thiamine biosynthesis lipoprotein
VRDAAADTGGLVDATQLAALRRAGYSGELGAPIALERALELAPRRTPARPGSARWRELSVDVASGLIARPAGLELDSGGLAKGLFADVLARRLRGHASFAVECAGDLIVGGEAGTLRAVEVESPFDGSVLHTFELADAGVATSGIGRRSWLDAAGAPAHHLLDPSTGRPAFTGIVQATAIAPDALSGEVFAKAALLSGPRDARRWLRHGGLIVLDDGTQQLFEPPPEVSLSELAGYARRPTRAPLSPRQAAAPHPPETPPRVRSAAPLAASGAQ